LFLVIIIIFDIDKAIKEIIKQSPNRLVKNVINPEFIELLF